MVAMARGKRSSQTAEESSHLANDFCFHAVLEPFGAGEAVREGVRDESAVLYAATTQEVRSVAEPGECKGCSRGTFS